MREIKFRAWDKEYGLSAPFTFGWVITFKEKTVFKSHVADGMQVMQFTGLKDKNGKEIYESDIVKTATEKHMVVGWSTKFASFVISREGWAFQHWFGEACDPEECEVIGNIHENPELLNA